MDIHVRSAAVRATRMGQSACCSRAGTLVGPPRNRRRAARVTSQAGRPVRLHAKWVFPSHQAPDQSNRSIQRYFARESKGMRSPVAPHFRNRAPPWQTLGDGTSPAPPEIRPKSSELATSLAPERGIASTFPGSSQAAYHSPARGRKNSARRAYLMTRLAAPLLGGESSKGSKGRGNPRRGPIPYRAR